MHVRKRNGDLQPVDLNKIVTSLSHYCNFPNVDVYKIATKTINGLIDGVTTLELDMLSVRTAKDLIVEDPVYSKVAARILANILQKEVSGQDIQSFSQSIEIGLQQGLVSQQTYDLVMLNKRKLNAAIKHERDWNFEYHGLQTVYDRYLLKHRTRPSSDKPGNKQRAVIETPQYFFMRVACGLSENAHEAVELYNLLSSLEYMASTPTLFNSGTTHSQMSSCFVAGTQILTEMGVKNIEDVCVGDMVVTHKNNIKEVTQLHKNTLENRVLFDIKCHGTPPITVTENHRFWSLSNEQLSWNHNIPTWNRADYLRKGDWIAIPNYKGGVTDEQIDISNFLNLFPTNGGTSTYIYDIVDTRINIMSEWTRVDHLNKNPLGIKMSKEHNSINRYWNLDNDFVQFLGIWYGDGHINKHRDSYSNQIIDGIGITAHKSNLDLIEFVKRIGQDYLGVKVEEYPHKDQNCTKLMIHSPTIGNMFSHLFGSYCDGKKLYGGAFKWSRGLFESFLVGLISTDGCVSAQGAVTISLANPPLVKQIYMLGRKLGMAMTFQAGQHKDGCLQQAAINIPVTMNMLARIQKTYDDERLSTLKPNLSTKVCVINDVTFVQIDQKNISKRTDEFVYTLGIEDDHSYPVEGILCENCYLLDSPLDSLDDIYKRYSDIALLSKFAGGIGVSISRLRGKGSLIRGTNGKSNGLVPWAHTLSASVAAVNQGGKRKGAACIYLETHHPDIMEFLELKDNTGEREQRAYNLNLANWVSDLFMKRVKEDGMWSLFDPVIAPELNDLYGDAYEKRYLELEAEGKFTEQLPARKVYARMMRTLAETGNGWMCFKDTCNRRGNQVNDEVGTIIHLSNLCVAPETLILTDKGHVPIVDLQDQETMVWNGEEFSPTFVKQTGQNQPLITVELDNGVSLDCTLYHKFYVTVGYSGKMKEVRANELIPGDKLIKFDLPTIEHENSPDFPHAYTHGFFSGDGTYSTPDYGTPKPFVALYGQKKELVPVMEIFGGSNISDASDRLVYRLPTTMLPKFVVPSAQHSLKSRVEWLCGLIDADGTVTNNKGCLSIQIGSIDKKFLCDAMLMLQTLGIYSSVKWMRDEGKVQIRPTEKTYKTQTIWRLLISSAGVNRLLDLGAKFHRVFVKRCYPNRTATAFTKVISVTNSGRSDDTYCFSESKRHMGMFNGILTGQCTEILEVTSSGERKYMTRDELSNTTAVDMVNKNVNIVGFNAEKDQFEVIQGMETAVCNLGSINIGRGYIKHGKLDKDKLRKNVAIAIKFLDRVVDRNFYPIPESKSSNMRWRPIGIGLMGLADFFFQLKLPFDSAEAIALSAEIQEEIYYQALKTSCELAKELGMHGDFRLTRAFKGQLQFDLAGVEVADRERWDALRTEIMTHGLRNSLLIAIAPTATISHICGVEECIEPIKSNLLKRETLSGEFVAINKYLVEDLRKIGRWNDEVRNKLKMEEGSITNIPDLPSEMYALYKTVWEMSMKSIMAHGVARGAFVDQSHSLNMFIDLNKHQEDKRIGVLSSLYMYAWESGLKTTYYFRSRAATRIEQTTSRPAIATTLAPEEIEVCESCT